MTAMQWVGASIIGLALVGCQQKAAQPEGPVYPQPVPVTAETRERIARIAPDAVVGRVIAVEPDTHLVAVGDVSTQEFKKGDIFMFLGGDDTAIGGGTVINVLSDSLHVRYQDPPAGGRPPAIGDLALHFKE